jgi:methenyltetrahydromethanopterin cyclohydrolase
MISLNRRVMPLVRRLIEDDEALGCRYHRLANGAHLIDMGIAVPGGWEAARLFTLIDIAGLGSVDYRDFPLDDQLSTSAVEVFIDRVDLACLSCQIAGLSLGGGEFAAIGSGPARALAARRTDSTDHCFDLTTYRDAGSPAVLGVQMPALPDDAFAARCAALCAVEPEDLYLLVHPSTALVGAVQVSARIVEQTINKMIRHGFDLSTIATARGYCAIAPLSDDELTAMGRINDCLLYGGASFFEVRASDEAIERIIPRLVTASSRDYGKLFKGLFIAADKDFYKMDLDIHSPAQVQIHNISTGRVFTAGGLRRDLLKQSFFCD